MEQVAMHGGGQSLPPSWRQCVGAGAARNGLRADWQTQLTQVVQQCGFRALRMDGLPEWGHSPYQAFDMLLDFLLDIDIRPLFRMHPNRARDISALVSAVRHAIARYGTAEVHQWRFELPVGAGFAAGAQALKALDPSLSVGVVLSKGRLESVLMALKAGAVRPDFCTLSCQEMPSLALLHRARAVLDAALPGTPIHLDASRAKPNAQGVMKQVADLAALHIDGATLAESLSCTHFSGLSGAPLSILDPYGVLQPLCHVYRFLSALGPTELKRGEGWIVTRTAQGRARALFYRQGPSTELVLTGLRPHARILAEVVDPDHGWAMPTWEYMGKPLCPTRVQTRALQRAAMDTHTSWLTPDAEGTLTYTPPEAAALVSLREP